MFDIGFSELMVIGVVALVVIGPERLPKVARTAGILFGRMQRYVTQVKSDISRELDAAELGKVKSEFEDAARTFKSGVESQAGAFECEMRAATESIERELADKAAATSQDTAATPAELAPPQPSPQMELGIEEPPAPAAQRPPQP